MCENHFQFQLFSKTIIIRNSWRKWRLGIFWGAFIFSIHVHCCSISVGKKFHLAFQDFWDLCS